MMVKETKTEIRLWDCLNVLKDIPDNSIDSIVSDPPYWISFMGKKWDYQVPQKDVWAECLRVLKPWWHALIACWTRTQHRMAVNLEDWGFEIRELIAWVYGSWFPKSHNLGKSVNKLETKEWTNICKSLDIVDIKDILNIWKNNLNNVSVVETQSKKNLTGAGTATEGKSIVPYHAIINDSINKLNLSVCFVKPNIQDHQVLHTEAKITTALQSVEAEIKQLPNLAELVEKLLQNHNHLQGAEEQEKTTIDSTVQWNANDTQKENTIEIIKVEEALMILRGNEKYWEDEIINVLCVAITNVLKHTILNQSKTFQNLGTTLKMECVSAINVIITEYMAELLITSTVNIAKRKSVDKLQGNEREDLGRDPNQEWRTQNVWQIAGMEGGYGKWKERIVNITKWTSPHEGRGTALKPAMELRTLCRKPLSEKTIAKNVLKHGTGGINIDECRVEWWRENTQKQGAESWINQIPNRIVLKEYPKDQWRFPANLIHDWSDEVVGLFPNSKSTWWDWYKNSVFAWGKKTWWHWLWDTWSNARFFYCAKASKSERNKGLEGFEKKPGWSNAKWYTRDVANWNDRNRPVANYHPTVKPIKLMQYLCRLITPVWWTILDPYVWSWSTGIGAKLWWFDFIGIEREEEYVELARARIDARETE